jgi:hypothetical protein
MRRNLKCEGRGNVIYSRARMFSSTHIAVECLDASDTGEAWEKRHMLQNPDYHADIVDVPRTGPDHVSPARPVTWFGPVASWTGAWNALIRFAGHLPTTLKELRAQRSAERKLPARQVQSHIGDVMCKILLYVLTADPIQDPVTLPVREGRLRCGLDGCSFCRRSEVFSDGVDPVFAANLGSGIIYFLLDFGDCGRSGAGQGFSTNGLRCSSPQNIRHC